MFLTSIIDCSITRLELPIFSLRAGVLLGLMTEYLSLRISRCALSDALLSRQTVLREAFFVAGKRFSFVLLLVYIACGSPILFLTGMVAEMLLRVLGPSGYLIEILLRPAGSLLSVSLRFRVPRALSKAGAVTELAPLSRTEMN